MKAIDLHIHTVATKKDSAFDFSIENLKKYIIDAKLDAIAITNHNIFDLAQYKKIKENVDIVVFPGIEVDLDSGHMLVIADEYNVNEFDGLCSEVEKITKDRNVSIEEFKDIYKNFEEFLFIPHYIKKPRIKKEVLRELGTNIIVGEVSSIKDFLRMIKDEKETIAPVWFSDNRIGLDYDKLKYCRTYIDIEDITIDSLRKAFKDKNNVKLSKTEGNKLFLANKNNLELSTGLNVIIGKRSSGKTHLLNEIAEKNENIKYIKQFELLDSKSESNDKHFNTKLANQYSTYGEEYLSNFKDLVDDVMKIEMSTIEADIDRYIDSLKKYAYSEMTSDIYSKSKLFNEKLFTIRNIESLDKLIDSLIVILENEEYKEIINNMLNLNNVRLLLLELCNRRIEIADENKLKFLVNDLISEIGKKLELKSRYPKITEVNFREYLDSIDKIDKFNTIVNYLYKEKVMDLEKNPPFKVVAKIGKFKNASDIKSNINVKGSLVEVFNLYDDPFTYLQGLKNHDDVKKSDIYKYFCKVEYDVLNRFNLPASGGERSEFNLIKTIEQAYGKDMLLIDEPESSFDNLFLNEDVNSLLKKISEDIPVIIVTHNNTVGLSIKPDYIVYTLREIDNELKFHIYAGKPSSKKLYKSGYRTDYIKTEDVLVECLEAGQETYIDRSVYYGIYKNKR